MKKAILVYDSNPDRRRRHCEALSNADVVVWQWEDEEIVLFPSGVVAGGELPEQWDLILLHAPGRDAAAFERESISGPVLRYGGDGGQRNNSVPRVVSAASPLTEDELKHFTDHFFDSIRGGIAEAIAATWFHEPKLALRLLCEAWQFTNGESTRSMNDVAVYAPTSKADWFAPFGLEPTEENASELAALMGEDEARARAVLLAAVGNGGIGQAIGDFLNPKAEGSNRDGTDGISRPFHQP